MLIGIESKPACLNCIKGRQRCPGYDLNVRLLEMSCGPHFTSEFDQASHDYFVTDGCRILATFHATSVPFWTRLALQLGQQHAAVRHSLIALGAFQRPLHHPDVDDLPVNRRYSRISPSAISHTTKAMRLLTKADAKSTPIEVFLACCMTFLAMSIWTERVAPPVHILAAHRMIQGASRAHMGESHSPSAAVVETIVPMLDDLIVHACAFSDDFPPNASDLLPTNYKLDIHLDDLHIQRDWTGAVNSIDTLLKCVLRVTSGATLDGIQEKLSLAFEKSDDMLQKFRTKGLLNYDSPDTEGGYFHLSMHHRMAHVMLHAMRHADESRFDSHHADFLHILSSYKRSRGPPVRGMPGKGSTPTLKTSLGVIPPLFFVATKCRDPLIRHQALDLLHDTSRNERGWTSCMAWTLAKFVIDQEEEQVTDESATDAVEDASLWRPRGRRRIRLERVKFSSVKQSVRLEYLNFAENAERPWKGSTRLPYIPHPLVEIDDDVTVPMSQKVLRACGYASIVLFTPLVACHCAEQRRFIEQ